MNYYARHRLFRSLLVISITLASVFVSNAQQTDSQISSQRSSVAEFEVNGLKVLVRRRENAKTVSGGLFIRGGARNIDEKTAGLERLTLQAATEASKNYSRDVLRRELSRTGSGIGAGVTNDYGVINFGTTANEFEKTWKIFADIVVNPKFAESDVERVRELILTALRNREDDADDYLDSLQDRLIYANHPYANDVSGTIETISSFKTSDLVAYHKKMLKTSQLLLVVVGNVDPNEVEQHVSDSFGMLPVGKYKETKYPKLDFSKSTIDVASRDLPTNYIKGIFDAPSIEEAEYYPMRVAITILRQRLFQEVRQKRQLSYAPSASLDTLAANTANIYVTAIDANRTVSVMLNEIKRLRREPVQPYDIESVAGGFLTSYYLDQETNAAQAVSLAQYELIGGGWKNSFDLLDKIRSVTPGQVMAVSKKYMKNLRFVVVGNPVAIEKDIFLRDLEEGEL